MSGQEHVPVEPLEGELPEVVEAGLAQQRQADAAGEPPRDRLGVVVEVDQQRLAEAAFDEAVGMAVEAGAQRLAAEEAGDVAGQDLALEMGDRAGLGGADVGGIADDEDVRAGLGLQGVLVDGDEAQRIAKTGRALDVRLTAVHRHRHGQVEADLAAVERDEPAAVGVDLTGVELGHHVDALLRRASRSARGCRRPW